LLSPWRSKNIRTARSRNSGEYFDTVFMTPSSQELESPGIPGRFSLSCLRRKSHGQFLGEGMIAISSSYPTSVRGGAKVG
jgi:hypothetical protein